jgi:hypothetical protein
VFGPGTFAFQGCICVAIQVTVSKTRASLFFFGYIIKRYLMYAIVFVNTITAVTMPYCLRKIPLFKIKGNLNSMMRSVALSHAF